jgi:hypothetical protein
MEPAKGDRVCVGCDTHKKTSKFRRNKPICIECEDSGVIYDKICKECEEVKPSDEFEQNRLTCHDCRKASGRHYRKTTTKAKEWNEENREKMQKLKHDYYEKNKKEIRKKESERLKTDPHFRMIKSYRKTICELIHGRSKHNYLLIELSMSNG